MNRKHIISIMSIILGVAIYTHCFSVTMKYFRFYDDPNTQGIQIITVPGQGYIGDQDNIARWADYTYNIKYGGGDVGNLEYVDIEDYLVEEAFEDAIYLWYDLLNDYAGIHIDFYDWHYSDDTNPYTCIYLSFVSDNDILQGNAGLAAIGGDINTFGEHRIDFVGDYGFDITRIYLNGSYEFIEMEPEYTWVLDYGIDDWYNITTVTVHEIGHTLGLGHIEGGGGNVIMQPDLLEKELYEFSNWDILSTRRLYDATIADVEDNLTSWNENWLSQNSPNPFSSSTTISFSLNRGNAKNVEIKIYNLKGQLIKTLIPDNNPQSSLTSVLWDGKYENGNQLSSGIYLYQLVNGNKVIDTKRMLLIR